MTIGSLALCLWASPVAAQSNAPAPPPHRRTGVSFLAAGEGTTPGATLTEPRRWARVSFQLPATPPATAGQAAQAAQTTPAPAPRPRAFVYSDAYRTRAKIHKIASVATLPLFAAEAFIGQSLYQNPTSGKKSAHLAVATGMGVLFGVNSVTGVWNLIEGRKDPSGRTRRILHSVLMLAADGGFFATAATAPDSEFGEGGGLPGQPGGRRSLHRAMAFTSIGLASAGYLIMLFGGR